MFKYIKIISIQLIVVLFLSETGLRLFSHYSDNLNALLYNPHILSRFSEKNSIKELLIASPAGFSPYRKGRTFVLNSNSLSTREYSENKSEGDYRILAIGDSFTDTSGDVPYRKLWPILLERQLTQQAGRRVDLIKLGVSGVGPRFELRLWQVEGRKLDADLVILAFGIGNDFTDEQMIHANLNKNIFDELLTYSYFARLLHNTYRLTGIASTEQLLLDNKASNKKRGGYAINSYYNPNIPTFKQDAFLSIVEKRMAITFKPDRSSFDLLLEALKPVLLTFNSQVISNNSKFLVMLIPDEYQVYPSLAETVLARQSRKLEDYDLDLPQRELISFFKENNIAYLDLLPEFKRAAETKSLYRFQNTHWNIAGNGLAAIILLDYLSGSLAEQGKTD